MDVECRQEKPHIAKSDLVERPEEAGGSCEIIIT
jgi:hypothetical protein